MIMIVGSGKNTIILEIPQIQVYEHIQYAIDMLNL